MHGVLSTELMPVLAVSLTRVYSSWTNSPEPVLSIRHRLHVTGVHAMAHATEMVNLQPLWNRPYELLIRDPVSCR